MLHAILIRTLDPQTFARLDYSKKKYAAIILAVAHDDFKAIDFTQLHNDSTVVFDAKSFIDTKYIDGRL